MLKNFEWAQLNQTQGHVIEVSLYGGVFGPVLIEFKRTVIVVWSQTVTICLNRNSTHFPCLP